MHSITTFLSILAFDHLHSHQSDYQLVGYHSHPDLLLPTLTIIHSLEPNIRIGNDLHWTRIVIGSVYLNPTHHPGSTSPVRYPRSARYPTCKKSWSSPVVRVALERVLSPVCNPKSEPQPGDFDQPSIETESRLVRFRCFRTEYTQVDGIR